MIPLCAKSGGVVERSVCMCMFSWTLIWRGQKQTQGRSAARTLKKRIEQSTTTLETDTQNIKLILSHLYLS